MMTSSRIILLPIIFLLLNSCMFNRGSIEVGQALKDSTLNVNISNVQVINNQFIITGTGLDKVTTFKIKDGGTTTDLQIESQSSSSLVANTLANTSFVIGTIFDFVLSTASAASTFQVTFVNSNNSITAPMLSAMGASSGQVMVYDGSSWVATKIPLSGLGAASATNTIDNLSFAQAWGWSTATTQNLLSLSANALTTGSILNLTTSSAAVNSTNGLLNVENSSASTNGVLARFKSNSAANSGVIIKNNGYVGIGTATASVGAPLSIGQTVTTGNNTQGITLSQTYAPTTGGLLVQEGININSIYDSDENSTGHLMGIRGTATSSGFGKVAEIYGGFFSGGTGFNNTNVVGIKAIASSSAGQGTLTGGFFESLTFAADLTKNYGVKASVVSTVVGGSVIDAYGLFSEVKTTNGVVTNAYGNYIGVVQGTNKYSLYASDAAAKSYFAGSVGVGTTNPGAKFQVGEFGDGTEARANAWTVLSDERLKRDFEIIPHSLEKILSLHGYYYYWNRGTDTAKKMGVKAQEVEKVFPEIVSHGSDGFLSVSYNHLVAGVIEGVKEFFYRWQSDSREKNKKIAELMRENAAIKLRLNRLEEALKK